MKTMFTALSFSALAISLVLIVAVLSGCPTPTPTPTISPGAGLNVCPQTVTITDTDTAAVIYFTTDGTAPTTSSPRYTGPFQVQGSETVQAMALDPNSNYSASPVTAVTFNCGTIPAQPAAPVFSPAPGGFYDCPITVSIADVTPGVQIFFTTDGTPPSINSILYNGPMPVNVTNVAGTTSFRAIANLNGAVTPNSQETDAAYTCKLTPSNALFNVIGIDVFTGADDARHNSEVDATVSDTRGTIIPFRFVSSGTIAGSFVLKPSDAPDGCGDSNGEWNGWTDCDQSFAVTASYGPKRLSELSGGFIILNLVQHYSFPDTGDNWNVQGIKIYARTGQNGLVCLLETGDVSDHQSNTPPLIRLTEGGGGAPTSVRFTFSAASTFGSCP